MVVALGTDDRIGTCTTCDLPGQRTSDSTRPSEGKLIFSTTAGKCFNACKGSVKSHLASVRSIDYPFEINIWADKGVATRPAVDFYGIWNVVTQRDGIVPRLSMDLNGRRSKQACAYWRYNSIDRKVDCRTIIQGSRYQLQVDLIIGLSQIGKEQSVFEFQVVGRQTWILRDFYDSVRSASQVHIEELGRIWECITVGTTCKAESLKPQHALSGAVEIGI